MTPSENQSEFKLNIKYVNNQKKQLKWFGLLLDAIVVIGNFSFLYYWVFNSGYLPEWTVFIRLFLISFVVIYFQRKLTFSIDSIRFIINNEGIITESDSSIKKIPAQDIKALLLRAKADKSQEKYVGLILSSENTSDTQQLNMLLKQGSIHYFSNVENIEQFFLTIKNRYELPVIELDEPELSNIEKKQKRFVLKRLFINSIPYALCLCVLTFGWAYFIENFNPSSPTVWLASFIISLAAVLFILFFSSSRLSQKLKSGFDYPEHFKKRINFCHACFLPSLVVLLVGVIALTEDLIFLYTETRPVVKQSSTQALPLEALDPPEYFDDLGVQNTQESINLWIEAVNKWNKQSKKEYEQLLLEALYDKTFCLPDPGSKNSTGLLAHRRNRLNWMSDRRRRLFLTMAKNDKDEEILIALIHALLISARELEKLHEYNRPIVSLRKPSLFRNDAYEILVNYLKTNNLSIENVAKLIHISQGFIDNIPSAQQLINTEKNCFTDALMFARYSKAKNELGSFSLKKPRMSYLPHIDEPETKDFIKIVFKTPEALVKKYESNLLSFQELYEDLKNTVVNRQQLIASWHYDFFGKQLIRYRISNMLNLPEFILPVDYDWPNIWLDFVTAKQKLSSLSYVAAIKTFKHEFGRYPETLQEICKFISETGSEMPPPFDYFSGNQLIYRTKPELYFASTGIDGIPDTEHDLVLLKN